MDENLGLGPYRSEVPKTQNLRKESACLTSQTQLCKTTIINPHPQHHARRVRTPKKGERTSLCSKAREDCTGRVHCDGSTGNFCALQEPEFIPVKHKSSLLRTMTSLVVQIRVPEIQTIVLDHSTEILQLNNIHRYQ
ncbi:hypothetical protein KIL84_004920 [Mauremys mutica]|uniref:Uncharacterized protein n=1 Tax=Mauremys mutica TaxID=74926 RepID=A0A9D3XQC2_9SAUR|nr:hypothetical protein KIL84_004920 [Mauremys mutica]